MEHARKRIIEVLTRPDAWQRTRALRLLEEWSAQYDRYGSQMPGPYTFADDEGRVEFEWHVGDRHLALTVNERDLEFVASKDNGKSLEGRCADDEAPVLVLWAARGSDGLPAIPEEEACKRSLVEGW